VSCWLALSDWGVADSPFYSDRVGMSVPRVGEEITKRAWKGLVTLIQQRVHDGSLAKAFPDHDCGDDGSYVTGVDERAFADSLEAFVPALATYPLDVNQPEDTVTALDVVEFVARNVDRPRRDHHGYFGHDHLFFKRRASRYQFDDDDVDDLNAGQEQFQEDVNLLFSRNGIAFELGDDLQIRRLGPPEARPLISDLAPDTGDSTLDGKINDAVARFLSRDPATQHDALEKLWDAFERLKTLEINGNKRRSAALLLDRAADGSAGLRSLWEAEFTALSNVGNGFSIRHHEHGQESVPNGPVSDYLFIRLAALIAVILRQTGRIKE
jgi:hypothetical protein